MRSGRSSRLRATALPALACILVLQACLWLGCNAFSDDFQEPVATHVGEDAVERFGVFERALESRGSYANPYVDVAVDVSFISPSGDSDVIEAFWDGGDVWRIRFSPDEVGLWQYTTTSTDPGLDGVKGILHVGPSDRSGGLRVSAAASNHFERQNGDPVWFLGDTQWAAFGTKDAERLNFEAFQQYVDVRAAQGFNVIHAMLMIADPVFHGLPEAEEPFEQFSDQRLNPAYWQEVDRRIAYMNSKGLTVALILAWGGNYGTDTSERMQWGSFPNSEARLRFARYAAARYSAFDTYFLISGEYDYSDGLTKADFIRIGDDLARYDPHDRLLGIHPGPAWVTEEFNELATWMSFGDYQQNYENVHDVALAARIRRATPIVNSEYGYYLRDQSEDGECDKQNSCTREEFRFAAYDILMAGAYIVTGFGSTYYGGIRDPGPFDVHAGRNDVAEDDIGHMRTLFHSVTWWNLDPRPEEISGDGVTRLLADAGSEYVAYVRDNASGKLSVLLNDPSHALYVATRFDPRTGSFEEVDALAGPDSITMPVPDGRDWVYILRPAAS